MLSKSKDIFEEILKNLKQERIKFKQQTRIHLKRDDIIDKILNEKNK
jgi:hypothetical protein